ncbi:sushi domain-containing protein 1-like [Polyodon spathula]|uniref:sushi domain-containing protein 1-like n=1 Tax=Polyodon spathula TaxID=7913 RepID=UPI001B7F782C|nr:sushi domain-containing protein 1-like [Polyodon spathula]
MKRNIVRMFWSSAEGCFALLLLLMFTRVQEGQAISTGDAIDICATCHANATCDKKTDGSGGMVCNCMYGFVGNGRTHCQDKDECQIGATNICGEHTACYNTYGSFYCTCLGGYSPSNRLATFIPNDGTYCNAVDCGSPPIIPHAFLLSATGTSYGSVVKYSCLQGYVLKSGNGTTLCNAGGEWEGPSLVCEVFVERGKNRCVCTANGFWANITLTCKEINCGIQPPVQYTDMIWDNTSQLGSVVYYKCKEGFYTEEGKNYSVCTANMRWENITLKCKRYLYRTVKFAILCTIEVVFSMFFFFFSPWGDNVYCSLTGVPQYYIKVGVPNKVLVQNIYFKIITSVLVLIFSFVFLYIFFVEIPAISDLNFKEGCLKWRAHRLKETYSFKLEGLRGYQKDFLDKRIINFTSGDDNPEICLTLQPGTNYTINITALSAGYSIRTSITTSIADPPVPEVAFIVAEGPLPPLRLLRAAETNGPISLYQVVVLPMDGSLVFNCSSVNMPNFYNKKGRRGAYVTAEFHAENIADELVFNVGDRQYYGDYYNAPLEGGRGYNIILRVVSEWCKVRKQSCVNWAQTKGLSHTIQHVTILAGGSVGVIGFILFLGFSIVWYCKKR